MTNSLIGNAASCSLLLSCSEENNVNGDIVGSWAYSDGSVFVDGVAVPDEDAVWFIGFDTVVYTFNADGTLEYRHKKYGDEAIPGTYSLDKQTRVLHMTLMNGDDIFNVTWDVKRLTDTELYLQQIEKEANIEYKDGEWNYQSEEAHMLLREFRFNRI